MSSGRLVNLSKEEYEAETSRVRATHLKYLLDPQGPRSWWWNVIAPQPEPEESQKVDDKLLGTLFHALLIEGRVDWHDSDVHRNRTHKAYQAVLDEAEGRPVLNSKESELLYAMREGVYRNAKAKAILEGPRFTEQVVLWEETIDIGGGVEIEIPCKMALDLWAPEARYCVKTTRHTTPQDYRRQCHELGYHLSAGFYERGAQSIKELAKVRAPFLHIVVGKTPPHYCYVWEMSRVWINNGKRQAQRALETLARCIDRELKLPESRRMEAYPDWLESDDDAGHLVPEEWMLGQYGEEPQTYDPHWEET